MTSNIISETLREKFHEANRAIQNAQKIVLLSHKRPDEDAIGAQLALYEYITSQLGKQADVICDGKRRERSGILPGYENIITKETLDEYDLVVSSDAGEIDIVFPDAIRTTKATIIQFDNHAGAGNKPFGNIVVAEPKTSATCHLLYYFLKEVSARITPTMATNLMTGISYDTGKFQHANTSADTLRVAGDLLELGAPLAKIQTTLYNKRSVNALRLWGKALSRVKVNKKSGMAISVITKKDLEETGADIEELSGLITMINSVKGSRFSLLLTEEATDTIKGSLRSEEYKGVDVSRIARLLGGGGHKLASGFKIKGNLSKNEKAQWQVK